MLTMIHMSSIAMEQKLRMYIASMEAKKETPCFIEEIKEEIMMDPEVQFIWYLLSSEWEEESGTTLLKMIISEWVKIHGFSYTSLCIKNTRPLKRQLFKSQKDQENNCSQIN